MEKPFKYMIICNKTNNITVSNQAPNQMSLMTYEPIEKGKYILKQTKTCYIDTRYEAKLRLYNYITFTKKGLPIPKYEPFKGTEIGKSIPILNF